MMKLSNFVPFVLVFLIAITFTGCGGNGDTLPLIPAGTISITPTTLPDGPTNVAYSQTLTATGGTAPYTWSITAGALPAGLTLDSASGVISGTPTVPGTSTFTVTATDSATSPHTASLALSITINAMAITTTTLPAATVNSAYSQTLAVVGGTATYTWAVTVGALPAGLTLDGATGVISGTPTTAGTSSFTITVTDSSIPAATDSQVFSLVVNPAGTPLSITTTTLPAATFGTAYSQSLAATGGTAPYTWSVSAGTLPSGLSLSGAGVISGKPLVSGGPIPFTVRVTDSTATTATQALSITITISASIANGKAIYDVQCAGCHRAGIYDTSGGDPDLGLVTSIATIDAQFSGGANHNGRTMSATEITDMFNFVSLF